MSRSKWKGPFINFKQLKTINTIKNQKIITVARNSKIIPQFIGFTFKIYNGKTFSEINVIDSMVGHKFGEFVFTRSKFSFKKKKTKK